MCWFHRKRNDQISVEQLLSLLQALSKKNDTFSQTLTYLSSDTSPTADVFREYLKLARDCGDYLKVCVKELELLLVDETGKKQRVLLTKIEEQCKSLETHIGNRTEYDLMKSVLIVKDIRKLIQELGRL